ncbi:MULTISPECIES: N(2)-fixation sustaining protein CowN [unclassified Agarivorans]|uniref:N(2)-fixation sustaining protein CowN n=1 Tax=unclassified Agarivorans TaxID=2636026 RepID=UPI0026E16CCC|nr:MULTISPECIES: N(2)-fixation sustaining protein CowN [unclassified Agarivorans]MDO6685970.1 N(2)-fixation sustaining protein CowN [Agarivorans sp. 3_MG-2023]MDO6713892.1 N(2)-fixation sustaining protein CowN [Agarivorans sp. 2_MG-2023]
MNNRRTDRYISFCNIRCDENADRLITLLDQHLAAEHGGKLWQDYFKGRRAEQLKMKRDNLNFIGNQTNPLYEYFALCDDKQASELLYTIEQECC